jgi:hypothetical protein
MKNRIFALGAVLVASAGLAQADLGKESVHASLGASYNRALTAPETLDAMSPDNYPWSDCVPEAYTPTGIPFAAIIGSIAFDVFTALEDQLAVSSFMEDQKRIPRSYATPWGCSFSKPACGLRGLMDQWRALYQTSWVPSADGGFSTIESVDIGPVNNGISYTCVETEDGEPLSPEQQFVKLITDITAVVEQIAFDTPDVKIVIADYPTVDPDQLKALVSSGVTQLPQPWPHGVSAYYDWRAAFRAAVCGLVDNLADDDVYDVRFVYPWGPNPVMFKEFQLGVQWNIPGYVGFHPEDVYMEQYAEAIGQTLEMSDGEWATADMNVCAP